ncbi:hypothetical protein MMF93_06550 [Streptomyces tubbatahanensis]|uniref:Tetratricopeptide repeat protein n=1 Tax=Streptomyces tubbatahanensis TaxID=2923272 RepID=A0ABY3XP21_9ACTN|nr:hypothetical protein [Streptomyces tubbatahanensis]UNS96198.1 hypothetical protein MMF93_06550 [Streptomyces tubbatahanensis]
MTPPPPPLTFRRSPDGRRPDPALDDAPLRTARDAFVQGHWAEARTLLQETGHDWDLRGHRVICLARTPAGEAWTREWQLAEPDSQDAALLLACAMAMRAARGKGDANAARVALDAAARAAPHDPTPWLALLLLFRRTATPPDCHHPFGELHARHPEHHHGHHLMAAALAEEGRGVYDFAAQAAERAPADSPLALLPVTAHAQRFRVLAARGEVPPDPTAAGHWHGRHPRRIVEAAFNWWLEWGAEDRNPRRLIDLNHLAYAKFHEGRMAEAAALFQRIGPHPTREPWAFSGREPHRAFRAAHRTALGAA